MTLFLRRLFLVFCLSIVVIYIPRDTLSVKEKHHFFLINSPFKKSKNLSRKQRKAFSLPPNAYNERFYELTMNPNLGYPTLSKKVELQNRLNSIKKQSLSKKSKTKNTTRKTPGEDNLNPWVSIGPNDVGGRTRGALFDLNDPEKDRIIAGGVSGGLWINEDIDKATPSAWTEVNGVPGNLAISVIVQNPNDHSVMYAGTGESYTNSDAMGNGIYKSTDYGQNWTMVFGNFSGTVTTTLNSGAEQSTVDGYFYINDIQIWDPTPLNTSNNDDYIFAIFGQSQDASNEYAEFYDLNNSGLYVSTNHGANWSKLALPSNSNNRQDDLNDIEVDPNNNTLWVSGTRSQFMDPGSNFYSSTDGINFTKVSPSFPTLSNANIGRVEIAPSSTTADKFYILLATTSIPTEAEIFKTTDGFNTLTKLTEPNDADVGISTDDFTRGQSFYDLEIEVDPNNDDIVYVGGINLFRSTDGGTSWSQISKWSENSNMHLLNVSLVHADQHGIYFKPGDSDKGIVVNDGGVYYASSFSTASSSDVFTSQESGFVTTQFYKVAQSPLSYAIDYIFGGTQDNGTLQLDNSTSFSGLTSSTEFTGGDGGFPYIDQINSKYLISNYVYNDAVYLYSLAGTTYSNGYSAMYLSNSNDGDSSDDTEGDFINPGALDSNLDILYTNGSKLNSYKIRRFIDLDSNSPSDNYITGLPNSPSAFHVSSHTSTSTTLLVGTDHGEVLLIRDAESNDSATQIGDFIGSVSNLKFGSNEQEIYVTLYNYGVNNIYFSSDGGASWSAKDGNLPDLPVLAIQPNPFSLDEVIIGTDLGVWKTTNFSAATPAWTQSNNGMTDVRVNDFEIRGTNVANNRVVASTFGRGIFTGNFNSGDVTSPTVVLTDTDADNTVSNSNVVTITATFSESMTATPTISLTDIISDQMMTATSSASQWVYTWTVSVVSSITSTTATVSGTDLSGNYYAGTDSITFTIIDLTSPTVTLSDTDSNNYVTNTDVVTITANFSESMSPTPTISLTGVFTDQIMTATASDSQWIYTWTVSVSSVTSTTATVSGTDLAGNYYSGLESITFTILNDSVAPNLTLSDTDADNIVSNTNVVTITATFSESMSATPTLSLSGIASDQLMSATASASQWIYGWTVSVTSVASTTATVSGTDLAGNYYTGTDSITFTIDNTRPTAALTDTDADNIVSNSNVVTLTATFSESMAATPTISLTGIDSNALMTATSSTSQWVYTWTVSVVSSITSTTATVSGTDLVGNYYAGTNSITFTIIDITSPTVSLSDTDSDNIVFNSDIVSVTALFSESMAATPTISLTGIDSNVLMTATSSPSQWVYTWTVSVVSSITSTTATISGTDLAGNYYAGTDSIVFSLNPTNNIPTNILLSSLSISENTVSGTTVGSFSTIDLDSFNTHTYSLVSGFGDTDNSDFSISGSDLLTATVFDYHTKNSYSIRVETFDGTATFSKIFTLSVFNEDIDGDGIMNSSDNCPSIVNINQADSDNDGVGDVCDNCVSFSNTTQTDTDADGIGNTCDEDDDNDGYFDSSDSAPLDPNEWSDSDNDGIGDNADPDDDNDGILDENDNCRTVSNPNQSDIDGDGRGDVCDNDADGDGFFYLDEASCGSSDLDALDVPSDMDQDYIADCVDDDSDNDGHSNTVDLFPLDPFEWSDNDNDGIGDNADLDDDNDLYSDQDEIDCSGDPLDAELIPLDLDGDLTPDCFDLDDDNDNYSDADELKCDSDPLDPSSIPLDFDGDLSPDCIDLDDDNDNFLDSEDLCPETPLGEVVGLDGCIIFYLPAKNFNVYKTEQCAGENSITVQVQDPSYSYNVAVSGAANTTESFTGSVWELENLSAGVYSICITVGDIPENIFQRCFEITITDPEPLNVYAMANLEDQTVTYNLKGGSVYKITHNGKTTQTQKGTHTIALEKGMNRVSITTGVSCQGIFEETYLNSYEVKMAPNPFKDQLVFNVGGTDSQLKVEIYAVDGRLIKAVPFTLSRSQRVIQMSTQELNQGSYYIKVIGENTNQSFKAIKE